MSPRLEKSVFVVLVVALSVALGWLFWVAGSALGRDTVIQRSMIAVPAVSAMLAARGFTWKRKLFYITATLGVYLLVGLLAELSGLHAYADRETGSAEPFLSLATLLYLVFLATFPLAMLVLFVGRSPARLWSSGGD